MDIFYAFFLGILQGATEFLPVSSSGHLVVAEDFFHIEKASLTFDVALHMGTLLSVLFFFRKDLLSMLVASISFGNKEPDIVMERRKVFFLCVATLPAVFAGIALQDFVESALRSPALVAGMLIVFGLLLLWSDKYSKNERTFQQLNLKDVLMIGFAQALAIIPGVSRSGVTMTAGLFRNLDRQAVARFSFLMSVPIISGAGLFNCIKIMKLGTDGIDIAFFGVGFLTSAVSGYLFISFLMHYVQNHSFAVFAYYRFGLAGVILLNLFFR